MNRKSIILTSIVALLVINILITLVFVVVPKVSAATGCFPDTNGHWAEEFICWLKDNGITSGYPDGTYKPERNVTRAEMAVFMQQLSGQGSADPVVYADYLDGLDSLDFAPAAGVPKSCRWYVVKEAGDYVTLAECSVIGPNYYAVSGGCYSNVDLIETCFPLKYSLRYGNGAATQTYPESFRADGWYGRWDDTGTHEVAVQCCEW